MVYDEVQLLDAVGPAEVFSAATMLNRGGYRLTIASPDGADVRTGSGIRLGVDVAMADITGRIDTLVVAGGLTTHVVAENPALADEVRALAHRSRRICSVCSGAFLLAACGLLTGRRATTHWAACTELSSRHPDITVEPDRIFVRDGPVYTSAGVTAGIDLALALVEADHGVSLAREIARWMVVFLQRPGGQSQFSSRLDHPVATDSPLRPVLDAVIADPAADHRLEILAQRAALSQRHLTRLFAEQAGTSPARFVERARVEAAREMLERSDLGVPTVARRCGFGSPETMRRAFVRVLGVPPGDYRERFRSTVDSPMLRETS